MIPRDAELWAQGAASQGELPAGNPPKGEPGPTAGFLSFA